MKIMELRTDHELVPSSTSANESQDIIELAREHPFLVPRNIKHMLDLEVSARTVQSWTEIVTTNILRDTNKQT